MYEKYILISRDCDYETDKQKHDMFQQNSCTLFSNMGIHDRPGKQPD